MSNIPIASNEWICADVEQQPGSVGFWVRLSRMAAKCGRSYVSLLMEIARLRLGAGQLSFNEYAGLRLYDNNLYAGADKKTFVGFKALQKIWIKANYRFDFFGLVNNKITADILLGTYGFPIMPTIAIFHEQTGRPSPFLLRSEDELRSFLTKSEHYPLFGKPMSGQQSVGSVSIERYDAAHQRLITTTGYGIPMDTFLSYVKSHAACGYIIQKRVSPHAEVRKICGDRLATVRLLTIMMRGKPKLLCACWKIPSGVNTADNFWRLGNLLAQLDLDNGRVLRVIRGSKTDFEEITHHPDTKAPMVGAVVPHWQEIKLLATEGAVVLGEMGVLGWDIAPVDSGAVIVEINETPDFKLHQLADRRGMMDTAFKDFLAERKRHAANWLRTARQRRRVITELVPPT